MVKPNKRQYAIRPRRWPWITAIVLACLAAAAAVAVVVFTDVDPTKKPKAGGDVDTEAPAQRADGCLGGSDPAAAVIAAQKAPHTPDGAAAFVATYLRWATETNGSSDEIAKQVLTPEALAAPKEKTGRGDTFTDPMRAQSENYEVLEANGALVKIELDQTFWNETTGESATTLAVFDVELLEGVWRVGLIDEAMLQKWADEGPTSIAAEKERLKAEGTPYDGSCS